ncbi:AAA family ATPase [Falsirhodobacter deserti]|uniref:AAA family ATPase n=1 Tax=Falsirhodobacter deserti TaxID=1365611 RepID=UPI0013E2F517|nr:AAA family ATPase [Falsirhodobacter deserti]
MNYIDTVEIEGFWGSRKVSLKLKDDLNFLIGPNGSGKTTIINLISAVLRSDIATLYSIQFDKVSIKLKTIGANKKPIIEVVKTTDPEMGSLDIKYTVKESSGDKGQTFGVEGPHDARLYRDHRYVNARYRQSVEVGERLSSILSKFVEVNWLSINRATSEMDPRRKDEGHQSPVDQKVYEISQAFSRYFSLLTSRAEVESKNFQEHVFLSLLEQNHTGGDVFKQASLEQEDRSTVIDVLKGLGVTNSKASRSVNGHYSRVQSAKKSYEQTSKLNLDEAITLSDAHRVSEMIKEWRTLQDKRQLIFEPRIKFESIINSLLSGKELHFDQRNVPKVHLASEQAVDIKVLSSGEKQLFILLGEALLQEGRPVVFISDEPELSLHVKWQSSLFKHVRSLNRSCQIISATHSPDIVGMFQDKVIKIESCISNVR